MVMFEKSLCNKKNRVLIPLNPANGFKRNKEVDTMTRFDGCVGKHANPLNPEISRIIEEDEGPHVFWSVGISRIMFIGETIRDRPGPEEE